jgi:hypothetical protein
MVVVQQPLGRRSGVDALCRGIRQLLVCIRENASRFREARKKPGGTERMVPRSQSLLARQGSRAPSQMIGAQQLTANGADQNLIG